MPYRVLIFDLFGTVAHFRAQVARGHGYDGVGSGPLAWLRARVASDLPDVPFDEFVTALFSVTQEIVLARPPEYREVPSRERFRRALERLGVTTNDCAGTAERLALTHMAYLATQVQTPPEHEPLLRKLAERYRLGLVSNFDHGPTARAILSRDGVADVFGATLISADFGRRKPHVAIFREALRQLGAQPGEGLYIGDSVADDVWGAHGVGMDVAWVNATGAQTPEPAPRYVVRDLAELSVVLER